MMMLSNTCTLIRNDNPDKGTETSFIVSINAIIFMIRNDNPDKGTETDALRAYKLIQDAD